MMMSLRNLLEMQVCLDQIRTGLECNSLCPLTDAVMGHHVRTATKFWHVGRDPEKVFGKSVFQGDAQRQKERHCRVPTLTALVIC